MMNRQKQLLVEAEKVDAGCEIPDTAGHVYNAIHVGGNGCAHFGDSIQNLTFNLGSRLQISSDPHQSLELCITHPRPAGLCLSQAPYIDPKLFIGRDSDLNQIHRLLMSDGNSTEQQRLVIGGMGGMGKTQLAIAYAKRYHDMYKSVFWLNAASEATLNAGLRSMAEQVFNVQDLEHFKNEQLTILLRRWLSNIKNSQWLLIFDNYDEPELYDIETYFPHTSHGTIIFTTRLPDQVAGAQLLLRPLTDLNHSLQILETRSQRTGLAHDIHAQRLAERLAGLPLALATAGSYLRKSTWSFERYLNEYLCWNISPRKPLQLQEYRDRTLYTTWDLSYARLERHNPDAAELLRLLAFFDHQTIWYDLLRAGLKSDLPQWLLVVIKDSSEFEDVMYILEEYCFVESQLPTQTYSMHACVHDWTMGRLNRPIEEWRYWYAFDSVAASIERDKRDVLGHMRYNSLTLHAKRLAFPNLHLIGDGATEYRLWDATWIAELLRKQVQFNDAATILQRALNWSEKTRGAEDECTLNLVASLGHVYYEQRELSQAERMLTRAVAGLQEVLGAEHLSTLDTANSLASIYADQGKQEEAEKMSLRAITGLEKTLGEQHWTTLEALGYLGAIYHNSGKLEEAEKVYSRALAGKEKVRGPDNMSTLDTVYNLGILYSMQGKMKEAEMMYKRSIYGTAKLLGESHVSVLNTVIALGILYVDQGELGAAEAEFERAFSRYPVADGNGLPPNAIQEYASFLSKAVRADSHDAQAMLSRFRRLVQHAYDWGKENVTVIYNLAKALATVRDDANAQTAFIKSAKRWDSDSHDSAIVICDGCDHTVNVSTGFHACRQCVDTDLCDRCMSQYLSYALQLPTCKDHAYLDVVASVTQATKSGKFCDEIDVDVWFDQLKYQYLQRSDVKDATKTGTQS